MKIKILTTLIGLLFALNGMAAERKLFDDHWRFALQDSATMSSPNFNDNAWRRLSLPHDWAIEGDFQATNPSGATGGALPGGIAWYRKHFDVPAFDRNKHYFIDFDGVYMNASVYLNGHLLGTRPYGFISYRYEMTPYLKAKDNVIAVRVDNSEQPNCRWYSGCGIYRHVYLVSSNILHVAHWGTFVTATTDGKVSAEIKVDNQSQRREVVTLRNTILDSSKKVVSTTTDKQTIQADAQATFNVNMLVNDPKLWSIEQPNLYILRTEVMRGNRVVDTYETTFGFRSFHFDAQTGFWLNGKNMKINGVCNHHDLGCLGAAVHRDAIYRQLKMLKDMGCNAIRCSHNPPAPELLELCDSMGFIVMDESFDMWHRKKTKYDYSRYFDAWFERDLSDMVKRDRNHPSILIWSIGNEVLEQWNSADADQLTPEQANLILNAGHAITHDSTDNGTLNVNSQLTKRMVDIVKQLDPTRPVTAGCNEPSPDNLLFKSNALDLIGYNYHIENIKDVPKNFPNKPFIMTESVSALQTTGYYMMPSDSVRRAPQEWWMPYTNPSFMCSAYDNMHAAWSSTHESTWDVVKNNDFVGGQFIWTGWDYLGEPTPYGFPARSSYFGIIDLAGFPKDVYYMYQSEWTQKPVLHLFPHWNWLDGQQIDMWCYSNQADAVELFINGKSQGIRHKKPHEYHVMWRVNYEPGTVKVVAYNQGKAVRQTEISTAGAPDHIRLRAENSTCKPGGLAFVEAEVVDKDGRRCPWADNQLYFETEGNGEIVGVDNGSQFSMERFKANQRKAFFGRCLVVVKMNSPASKLKLKARGIDLKADTITIESTK